MHPLVPALVLLAARPVASIVWVDLRQNFVKITLVAALIATLVISSLYSLAFVSIYRTPDTRIQTEEWIAHNISAGAIVAVDGPDQFADPFIDAARYQIHVLPVYEIYNDATPRVYSSSGVVSTLLGKRLYLGNNQGPASIEDFEELIGQHLRADYSVVSNRFTDQVAKITQDFGPLNQYYLRLFDGRAGFELLMTFDSQPSLLGFTIDDRPSEHTFRIFDHPTIYVFRRLQF